MRLALPLRVGLALAVGSTGQWAAAQCQPEFQHFPVDYVVPGDGVVRDLALWDPDGPGPQGELLVAVGLFDAIGDSQGASLGLFDPASDTWLPPLPPLTAKAISRVAAGPQGQLAVSATPLNTTPLPETIFTWNGTGWDALPKVSSGSLFGSPSTLEYGLDGDLYCMGYLEQGSLLTHTARWDGAQWHDLGGGLPAIAGRMHIAPDGTPHASGSASEVDFGALAAPLARWDGSQWVEVAVGTQVEASTINDFAFLSNNEIAAGGFFTDTATGQVSIFGVWNGSDWEIPTGSPGFDPSVSPTQIAVLPSGEVLFCSAMVGADGAQQERMVKWDGLSLTPFATAATGDAGDLSELEVGADGAVWAGGRWTMGAAAQQPSGLSRTHLPCPASVQAQGASGSGSAGPLDLQALLLPWLGGAFVALTTGLDPDALAYTLIGQLGPGSPLSEFTPIADPGSSLYVQPNFALSQFLVNQQGSAGFSASLPSDPTLVGLGIGLQVASIELDASGVPAQVATSNALALTFGSY